MLTIEKKYYDGYAILPCFRVKAFEGGGDAEMVCNDFLAFIFRFFFAPFWSGRIYITGEHVEN